MLFSDLVPLNNNWSLIVFRQYSFISRMNYNSSAYKKYSVIDLLLIKNERSNKELTTELLLCLLQQPKLHGSFEKTAYLTRALFYAIECKYPSKMKIALAKLGANIKDKKVCNIAKAKKYDLSELESALAQQDFNPQQRLKELEEEKKGFSNTFNDL